MRSLGIPWGVSPIIRFFVDFLAFFNPKMLSIVCSGHLEVSYALHLVLGPGLKASLAEIRN